MQLKSVNNVKYYIIFCLTFAVFLRHISLRYATYNKEKYSNISVFIRLIILAKRIIITFQFL